MVPATLPPHALSATISAMSLNRIITIVCVVILLIVGVQSLFPRPYGSAPPTPQADMTACLGDPIEVDFPFLGTVNDPWTCKVQCDNNKPRYILYTNGRATQCETPPGCNDIGEDNNIACIPPVKSAE